MPITELIGGAKVYGWGSLQSLTAFESIATTTVIGSVTDAVTFSNIPQTYQHLQIRGLVKRPGTGSGSDPLLVRINGITSSVYDSHWLSGFGTSTSASSSINQNSIVFQDVMAGGTGNWGAIIIDVADYKQTNKNKTLRCLSGYDNNGFGVISVSSGLYRQTSAISSISLIAYGGGYFAANTNFSLYGIKGAL